MTQSSSLQQQAWLMIAFVYLRIATMAVGHRLTRQRCWLANECDALLQNDCRPPHGYEHLCAEPQPSRHCQPAPLLACYCRAGYARNSFGACVPLAQCRPAPNGGQVVCADRECARQQPSCRCEAYCSQLRSNRCLQHVSGCHCARGYARDWRDVCVPHNMCRPNLGA